MAKFPSRVLTPETRGLLLRLRALARAEKSLPAMFSQERLRLMKWEAGNFASEIEGTFAGCAFSIIQNAEIDLGLVQQRDDGAKFAPNFVIEGVFAADMQQYLNRLCQGILDLQAFTPAGAFPDRLAKPVAGAAQSLNHLFVDRQGMARVHDLLAQGLEDC